MPKNISIYLSNRLLQLISDAMKQLGYSSRSEFFRTASREYLEKRGYNIDIGRHKKNAG